MNIEQLAGKTIGGYEVRELLGKGAMSVVYAGYQPVLRRQVAIKIMLPMLTADQHFAARFNREFAHVDNLQHPHIAEIYDYGIENDLCYVVRRLFDGGTLADRMFDAERKPRLPSVGEAGNLLRQLADGLDYAHGKGIVHAALNPNNIIFDQYDDAYINDFGIARLARSAPGAMTATGFVMGTPAYMAPEQWQGMELTPATDQYVLAVILYQVLTGEPPFVAGTPFALMHKHLNEPVPPLNLANTDSELDAVLGRALAKKPEDRFPNVTDFSKAYRQATRSYEGEPTGFFQRPSQTKTPQRHIFLSYSRADSDLMGQVRDGLRTAGLTVWTDETLTPGTPSWKKSIEKAIEDAGALVVLLSPDSKNSEWVERELGYARVCNVQIFPVLCRGDERSAIPFELVNTQRTDIRTGDLQPALTSLVPIIRNQLSQQV